MSEHLSDQTIERYRQRVMPPAELLAVNDHLAACETCYQRFGSDVQLEAAYTFLRGNLQEAASAEPGHLVYEQIAAYVDAELKGKQREALESHIKLCHQCESEVSDLRALRETLRSYEGFASITPPTFRNRLAAFWRLPAYRISLQIASTAAIAALVVLIATVSLRTRVADLQAQLAQLRQENERIQQEYKSAEIAIADLKAQLEQSQSPEFDQPQNILLALNDGDGQVTLDKQGNLEGLKPVPSSYEHIVKTALTTERVTPPPIIARLVGNPRNLMGSSGDGASFTLLSPIGTVVQTDRPTFRWSSLNGAAGYTVTLYDSNSKEVATSQLLSATEWMPSQPLKRGRIYAWQVRALKDGDEIRIPAPDAPDAKFRVLERAKADEMESARQAHANSHLLLGILYAQAGLLDNAEQEFQALLDANPKSRVARNLLRSVKAMRRK